MKEPSVLVKRALIATLVSANLGALGLLVRSASAQESEAATCNIPGSCECIIVDPVFGYCSNLGYPWEPPCTSQESCKKDPE